MSTITNRKNDKGFYEIMGRDYSHGAKYAFSLMKELLKYNDIETMIQYVTEQEEITNEVFMEANKQIQETVRKELNL